MRKEGEKKSREDGTYDAGCGNVEDDGLVGGIVCYVKSLYEDGLWRFAVGDGGGNCGAERMRTRGGEGWKGENSQRTWSRALTRVGARRRRRGARAGRSRATENMKGKRRPAEDGGEGYKSTVEEVSGTEGHADKGVL